MIGSVPRFKLVYFDRRFITKGTNWNKLNRGPLQKAGAAVRVTARRSIKRRKKQPKGKRHKEIPSPIGQAPRSRQPGSHPPMKFIRNEPHGRAAEIVGMVGFGGKSHPGDSLPVPGLHEHGGSAVRNVWIETGRTKRKGKRKRRQSKYVIQKKLVTKRVVYEPRPFMWPALLKVKHQLPHLWQNSIHRLKGAA